MTIHDAVAVTDASPYRGCGSITPNFAALVGKTIKRGWTKDLKDAIGGAHGCTHLWELLGRIAAVAYQATGAARERHRPAPADRVPYQFMSCHMYTPESLATYERWPQLYRGAAPQAQAAESESHTQP
jgi:hypothetical protein